EVFGLGTGRAALQLPPTRDPDAPLLVEKRLRRGRERGPQSDAPVVGLRALDRSRGDRARVADLDGLGPPRSPPQAVAAAGVGGGLGRGGYDWWSLADRRFRITYYWKARRRIDDDYAAFAHVEGPGFRFQDDHLLGVGTHLTHAWAPGETVKDSREIDVPSD